MALKRTRRQHWGRAEGRVMDAAIAATARGEQHLNGALLNALRKRLRDRRGVSHES